MMNPLNPDRYYSNGNLILSGEYYVLAGALALAVPLKKGQGLTVERTGDGYITWEAFELGKPWFNALLSINDLKVISHTDIEKASFLKLLFQQLIELNPGVLGSSPGFRFSSEIDFNTTWGWGSSATLITNLSRWAGVDPFLLNRMVSSGSGYDIAAASSNGPVLYRRSKNSEEVLPVNFNPPFKKHLYFAHMGKKQNTGESIRQHMETVVENTGLVKEITSLSQAMATEERLDNFMNLMSEHEEIVSTSLQLPKIKKLHFSNFEGEVKSLGAWGGDFIMIASELDREKVYHYFSNKGIDTIFRFEQIIKN